MDQKVKAIAYKHNICTSIRKMYDQTCIDFIFVPDYKLIINAENYAWKSNESTNRHWTNKKFVDKNNDQIEVTYENFPTEEIEIPIQIVEQYMKQAELKEQLESQQKICNTNCYNQLFPINFKNPDINKPAIEKEIIHGTNLK